MLIDSTTLVFPRDGQTTLPLVFEPHVLRCATAGPGGRPLMVLIDTGTDPSAIDLGLARRLGLRLGDFALGQGAVSDAVPFTETVLPWLRLGDLVVRDLFALALDLRSMPFGVDLVLGYNVLRQLVLHIDYRRRRLLLRHSDLGEPVSSNACLLPLTFFEHFPTFCDVVLENRLVLPRVTIDTGSNGGLSLGPDLAEKCGLHAESDAVSHGRGSGFGGDCTVIQRRAAGVRIGPFTLHDVTIDAQLGLAGDLGRHGRANMGNHILSRFASLTLDYGRAHAWIESDDRS